MLSSRRHRSSTAATPTTATTSAAPRSSAERGIALRGLRDQRRRLRPRPRLLPDDRRPRRGGRSTWTRSSPRSRRASTRPSAPPGMEGEPSTAENGYLHCGPSGAGHFVKMVHNGIEYGVMAAYAEGLNILKNADAGTEKREADAETAPMDEPGVLPLRHRHPGGRRGLAPRQRDRLVAARPDGGRAAASRRTSRTSPDGSPTRARGAGPRSPRSTRASRRRSSPARCTRASPRAASTTSPTRCSPRCASSSAATRRSRAESSERRRRTPTAAARRAAELIAAAGREAVDGPGAFSLALSGGTTPRPMFEALADADLPWDATTRLPGGRARRAPGRSRSQPDPPRPRPPRRAPGASAPDAGRRGRPRRSRRPLRHGAPGSARPGPPRHRARRAHGVAGPGRSGARGRRPARGDDRRRVPGPPPHDAHLPGASTRRAGSCGSLPARTSATPSRRMQAGDADIPAGRVSAANAVLIADATALG